MKNFILILFSLFTVATFAQEKISLKLSVVNEFTKESISFADVKVVNTTSNQKVNKKTNFNGSLTIDLQPEMEYQIFVSKESDSSIVIFQEKSNKFSTKGVSLGSEIEYKVKLRPIFQKDGLKYINTISFDIFSFDLDKENKAKLDNVIDLMKENSKITLEVSGYASCNLSIDDANSVSVERANTVVRYLTNAGIEYDRISALAWGKEKNFTKCVCEPEKAKDKPCTKKDHLRNSKVGLEFKNISE